LGLGLGRLIEDEDERGDRELVRYSSTMSLSTSPTDMGTGTVGGEGKRSSSNRQPSTSPRLTPSYPESPSPQIDETPISTPPLGLGSRFKLGSGSSSPSIGISDSAIKVKMTERKISDNSIKSSTNTIGSSSSGANNSSHVLNAEHGRKPSINRVSTNGPGGGGGGGGVVQSGMTPGNGYVSARITRELERQKEVDASRKKQQRDTSVGVVVKEDGTVIRDGFKIVDGVAKRSASSGVYTRELDPYGGWREGIFLTD
jgi:hypothetical protein